jgi:putative PEP-CTERM system TPR-repeat lipoprotein
MTSVSPFRAAKKGRLGATLVLLLAGAAFLSGCGSDPAEERAAAEASIAAGDLRTASIHVSRGLQSRPSDPDLHALKGRIELESGDFTQAQKALVRAIELGATGPHVTKLLADTLIQQGDNGSALETLDGVSDADRDSEYWLLRGEALLQTGAMEDASAALARSASVGGESSRRLVTEARLEHLAQRDDSAAQLFDRAVAVAASRQGRAEALNARASFNASAERLKEASNDLQQAAEIYADAGALTRSFNAQLALVEVLLTLGDLDSAEKAAARLASFAPNAPLAAYAVGAVAYRQGRYADALTNLQAAVNGLAENTQLRTMLGAAHLASGNVNQAEQQFLEVLGAVPDDVTAAKLLARMRLQQGRADAALSVLRAVPDDQADAEVEMLRSAASLSSGDARAAVEHAEQAVTRDPDDQSLQLDLARMYLSLGRDRDALAILDTLSTGDEALNAEILKMFSRLRAGESVAGGALAAGIVQRFPKEPRAFLAAAMFAKSTGDNATAEQRLKDAILVDPNFFPARLALAAELAGSDRIAEAEQQLNLALELEPNNTSALVALARLSLVRGEVAEADSLLTRAVAAAPAAMRPRFALGDVKVRLNQLDAALALAEELGRDFPNGAEGPFLAGKVRMAQKRYGDAAASFETAFGRSRTWPALGQQIQSLRFAGRNGDAIRGVRAWLAEHSDDAEARLVLAELLQAEGRGADAISEYDQILAGTPVNVVALNNAAWLLREQDPPRALALAKKAVELAPDHPAVLDTLGWLLVERGRAEEGLVHVQRAAELAPAAADIQYHLAHALVKVARDDEARVLLESLLGSPRPFSLRREAEALSATLSRAP